MVLDRATGDFYAANPKHNAPIVTFPSLHVTRHDFGDLDAKKPPYAEFPYARTRIVESVTVVEANNGLELTVKGFYADVAGSVSHPDAGRIAVCKRYLEVESRRSPCSLLGSWP